MRETSEPAKTTTIREVALKAGVSRSSVSNFMNGRFAKMSPETRERIAGVIESLNYTPSRLARQLKTGKVTMLGLLVPTVVNPFFGELAFAIEQAALKHGHHVLLCNTMRDEARELEIQNELLEHGIRGIIIVSPMHSARARGAPRMPEMATVGIDVKRSTLETSYADLVNIDNRAAAEMAVRHLVSLGHRRIAYVTDRDFTFSRGERQRGFLEAIEAEGLVDCPVIVKTARNGTRPLADTDMWELGREGAAELLALSPRPTAAIAINDMVAIGMLASLRQAGIAVPGEISVVGMDDISLSRLITPTLSTIRQPIEEMANAAVERLIARLSSPERPGTDTVFQPLMIERESSGPLP